MAISATVQRAATIAFGDKAKAAALCDAIDTNTTGVATNLTSAAANATLLAAGAAISTTTTHATTAKLHTMVKSLVAAITA